MNETIEKFLRELLTKAGFVIDDIEISLDGELNTTIFTVKSDDSRLLIGRNGDVLRAVNHLVQRALEKDYSLHEIKNNNILVDVNGYHQKKINEIKTKARIVADRARSFKSNVSLDPMSSYDRLVVHSFVSTMPDVETESLGEGPDRHVVIKYVG